MDSAANSTHQKMVLFVCVENTFRSVLSEAIFNSMAPKGWVAESAGVEPAEKVNPLVYELLEEIGVKIGEKTPRLVIGEMIARATRVVTFGCLDRCPIGAENKSEDWPIPGSMGKTLEQLREIRNEIQRRIPRLIEKIERPPSV